MVYFRVFPCKEALEYFGLRAEEWDTFWKGNLSWNTRVKGHPAGAPSARMPAGLLTLSS